MATRPKERAETAPVQEYRMCPRYEHAIQLLGKRWTGLLLDTLMTGPKRFCELTSAVEGLSDRVLSDRLRELEAENIIERVVYPHIPVRVEYQLTEKGRALRPVVETIHAWAEQWLPLPEDSAMTASGHDDV
jgi:DNA-binding HxlR family transcriptional regulator